PSVAVLAPPGTTSIGGIRSAASDATTASPRSGSRASTDSIVIGASVAFVSSSSYGSFQPSLCGTAAGTARTATSTGVSCSLAAAALDFAGAAIAGAIAAAANASSSAPEAARATGSSVERDRRTSGCRARVVVTTARHDPERSPAQAHPCVPRHRDQSSVSGGWLWGGGAGGVPSGGGGASSGDP